MFDPAMRLGDLTLGSIGEMILLLAAVWWVQDRFFSARARAERSQRRDEEHDRQTWERLDRDAPAEAERLRALADRVHDYEDPADRETFNQAWRDHRALTPEQRWWQ